MEDYEVKWDDPRLFGSAGRYKRSHSVLHGDLTNIVEIMNTLRRGFGFNAVMESPVTGDKKILGFNNTSDDLPLANILSVLIGAGSTVTWALKQGTSLAGLVNIFANQLTDSVTGGNTHTALATETWDSGKWLVLEIISYTGSPEQLGLSTVLES